MIISSTKNYIKSTYGDSYVGNPKMGKKNANMQDAHEGIRPTSVFRTPDSIKSFLTPDEYKIYKLIYVRALAKNLSLLLSGNPDINPGINIVKNALMYPLKQICSNAGVPGDVVVEKLVHSHRQDRVNYGYNAKTNLYGDLIEMGVIDPAKAVRVALENAASVAGLFLTTECVIVDDIE